MRRITSSMSNGSFVAPLRARRAAMPARGGKNDARARRSRGSVTVLRACPLRLDLHEQPPQRFHDAVVSLSQKRRQDVLADLLAPQMVAAVAPGMRGGIEIHP